MLERAPTVKRNSAQVLRDKVQIRLAVNEAGPRIAELLKLNNIDPPGVDWTKDIFPGWLIATVDDEVIGCCQLCFSKPFGYVEMLMLKPGTPFKLRAIAVRKLYLQSLNTLHANGCVYAGGYVDQRNKKFANVLDGLNWDKTLSADLFVKRIR